MKTTCAIRLLGAVALLAVGLQAATVSLDLRPKAQPGAPRLMSGAPEVLPTNVLQRTRDDDEFVS